MADTIVDLEIRRKLKDGSYKIYHPFTKAKNVKVAVPGVEGTEVETVLKSLFQFADSGKKAVASAITAKGVSASPTDTFSVLAAKVGQITTGKKFASGIITRPFEEVKIYTISGLEFRPSCVIIFQDVGTLTFLYNKNPQITLPESLQVFNNIMSWVGVTNDGFAIKSNMPNNLYKNYWLAIE